MRTASLMAGAAAATAVAGVALRGPVTPTYDGPVALAAPATSPADDWVAVVTSLDSLRAAAYADPATADPSAWSDADCPCLAEDRRRLAALAAAGRALDLAPVSVTDLVAEAAGDRVEVVFTDELAPYAEVDAVGRVVRAWPGRGAQRWRGVLVRAGDGWRWRDLVAVPDDHDPARSVDPRSPG